MDEHYCIGYSTNSITNVDQAVDGSTGGTIVANNTDVLYLKNGNELTGDGVLVYDDIGKVLSTNSITTSIIGIVSTNIIQPASVSDLNINQYTVANTINLQSGGVDKLIVKNGEVEVVDPLNVRGGLSNTDNSPTVYPINSATQTVLTTVEQNIVGAINEVNSKDLSDNYITLTFASSPYTVVVATGTYFKVDTSGGDVVINLPSCVAQTSQINIVVKKITSENIITINPNGADTIDGRTSYVIVGKTALKLSCNMVSAWTIVADYYDFISDEYTYYVNQHYLGVEEYGSREKPFKTIQACLTEIGNPVDLADERRTINIVVETGQYDENIIIPAARTIRLLANGLVVLGDGAGRYFTPSTTPRNITYTVDDTKEFANNPRPTFTLMSYEGLAISTHLVYSRYAWIISGNVLLDQTAGVATTIELNFSNTYIEGNIGAGPTLAPTGIVNSSYFNSRIVGTVSGLPTLNMNIIDNSLIEGAISGINSVGVIRDSSFSSTIGCGFFNNYVPLAPAIIDTYVAGTITTTGVVSTVKVDSLSEALNEVVVAGTLSKSNIIVESEKYQNITPLTGPYTGTLGADCFVVCDTTAGDVDITLPLTTLKDNSTTILIKKSNTANLVNILCQATETIDGIDQSVSPYILSDLDFVEIVSDTVSNWHIVRVGKNINLQPAQVFEINNSTGTSLMSVNETTGVVSIPNLDTTDLTIQRIAQATVPTSLQVPEGTLKMWFNSGQNQNKLVYNDSTIGDVVVLDDFAFENVFVVAKTGAKYSTITSAIADAVDGTPTLIYVFPGTYVENITLKDNMCICGSDTLSVHITSTTGSTITLPAVANTTRLTRIKISTSPGAGITNSHVISITGTAPYYHLIDNCVILGIPTSTYIDSVIDITATSLVFFNNSIFQLRQVNSTQGGTINFIRMVSTGLSSHLILKNSTIDILFKGTAPGDNIVFLDDNRTTFGKIDFIASYCQVATYTSGTGTNFTFWDSTSQNVLANGQGSALTDSYFRFQDYIGTNTGTMTVVKLDSGGNSGRIMSTSTRYEFYGFTNQWVCDVDTTDTFTTSFDSVYRSLGTVYMEDCGTGVGTYQFVGSPNDGELQLSRGIVLLTLTVTSDYGWPVDDWYLDMLICNTTSNDITLTFPPSVAGYTEGRNTTFFNTGTNLLIVDPNGVLIDGDASIRVIGGGGNCTIVKIGTGLKVMGCSNMTKYVLPSGVPNLEYWMDGSDQTTLTLDGTNSYVAQWDDKSGNTRNASNPAVAPGTLPAFVDAYQNGKSVVRCDRSRLSFLSWGTVGGYYDNTAGRGMTIIVLCRPTIGISGALLSKYSTSTSTREYAIMPNLAYLISGTTSRTRALTMNTNEWQFLEMNWSPGDYFKCYVNKYYVGPSSGTITSITDRATVNHKIGYSDATTTLLAYDGYIAEIVMYSRSITRTESDNIINTMAAKWNIESIISETTGGVDAPFYRDDPSNTIYPVVPDSNLNLGNGIIYSPQLSTPAGLQLTFNNINSGTPTLGIYHYTTEVANFTSVGDLNLDRAIRPVQGTWITPTTITVANSPYTITTATILHVDTSGGDVIINLPNPATYPGKQILIKKISNLNKIYINDYTTTLIDESQQMILIGMESLILRTNTANTKWYVECMGDGQEAKTGFENLSSTIAFTTTGGTDLTLTLTFTGTCQLKVKTTKTYVNGDVLTATITPAVSGLYAFFINDSFTLTGGLISDYSYEQLILQYALVAETYWDDDLNQAMTLFDERHGYIMDSMTHFYLHQTRGSQISGSTSFTISSNTTTTTPTDDTNCRVYLSGGTFWDEDLEHTITYSATPTGNFDQDLGVDLLATGAGIYPIWYRLGATGAWKIYSPTDRFPFAHAGTTTPPYYNEYTGATWQLTAVPNNDNCIYWMFATNSRTNPVILIMGQDHYDNDITANAISPATLSLTGLPQSEYKMLYKINIRHNTGWTATTHRCRISAIIDYKVEGISNTISGTSVSNHAALLNLPYDLSGHTGFQRQTTSINRNPTVNDDDSNTGAVGYNIAIGDLWINTTTNESFECFSATTGSAVWKHLYAFVNPSVLRVGPYEDYTSLTTALAVSATGTNAPYTIELYDYVATVGAPFVIDQYVREIKGNSITRCILTMNAGTPNDAIFDVSTNLTYNLKVSNIAFISSGDAVYRGIYIEQTGTPSITISDCSFTSFDVGILRGGAGSGVNLLIENCYFTTHTTAGISNNETACAQKTTIRRCIFATELLGIDLSYGGGSANRTTYIEESVFTASTTSIYASNTALVNISNCQIAGTDGIIADSTSSVNCYASIFNSSQYDIDQYDTAVVRVYFSVLTNYPTTYQAVVPLDVYVYICQNQDGKVFSENTTDTTAPNTGSFQTLGGIYAEKTIWTDTGFHVGPTSLVITLNAITHTPADTTDLTISTTNSIINKIGSGKDFLVKDSLDATITTIDDTGVLTVATSLGTSTLVIASDSITHTPGGTTDLTITTTNSIINKIGSGEDLLVKDSLDATISTLDDTGVLTVATSLGTSTLVVASDSITHTPGDTTDLSITTTNSIINKIGSGEDLLVKDSLDATIMTLDDTGVLTTSVSVGTSTLTVGTNSITHTPGDTTDLSMTSTNSVVVKIGSGEDFLVKDSLDATILTLTESGDLTVAGSVGGTGIISTGISNTGSTNYIANNDDSGSSDVHNFYNYNTLLATMSQSEFELLALNYASKFISDTLYPKIIFRRAKTGPAVLVNTDIGGQLVLAGYDGTNYSEGAKIDFIANETWSGTARGSDVVLYAVQKTTTTQSEVLRIAYDYTTISNYIIGRGYKLNVSPGVGVGYFKVIDYVDDDIFAISNQGGFTFSPVATYESMVNFVSKKTSTTSTQGISFKTSNNDTALNTNEILGNINFYGHNGVGQTLGAKIEMATPLSWTGTNNSTRMGIYTSGQNVPLSRILDIFRYVGTPSEIRLERMTETALAYELLTGTDATRNFTGAVKYGQLLAPTTTAYYNTFNVYVSTYTTQASCIVRIFENTTPTGKLLWSGARTLATGTGAKSIDIRPTLMSNGTSYVIELQWVSGSVVLSTYTGTASSTLFIDGVVAAPNESMKYSLFLSSIPDDTGYNPGTIVFGDQAASTTGKYNLGYKRPSSAVGNNRCLVLTVNNTTPIEPIIVSNGVVDITMDIGTENHTTYNGLGKLNINSDTIHHPAGTIHLYNAFMDGAKVYQNLADGTKFAGSFGWYNGFFKLFNNPGSGTVGELIGDYSLAAGTMPNTAAFIVSQLGSIYFPNLTATSSYVTMRYNTASGRVYVDSSSEKFKKDIEPVELDTTIIDRVQLKKFLFKDDPENEGIQFSYIAEEVHDQDTTENKQFIQYQYAGSQSRENVFGYHKDMLVFLLTETRKNIIKHFGDGTYYSDKKTADTQVGNVLAPYSSFESLYMPSDPLLILMNGNFTLPTEIHPTIKQVIKTIGITKLTGTTNIAGEIEFRDLTFIDATIIAKSPTSIFKFINCSFINSTIKIEANKLLICGGGEIITSKLSVKGKTKYRISDVIADLDTNSFNLNANGSFDIL